MAEANAQPAPNAQPQAVNPLDQPAVKAENGDSSNFLQSIVKTESGEGAGTILQDAPEIDQSLLQSVGAPKNFLLTALKVLFALLILGSVVSLAFFTSQLTNKLDFVTTRFEWPNVSSDLSSSNTEIITLQTDINFYRYLKAKAFLDEFSFYGDSFVKNFEISNSQTAANADKSLAKKEMADAREVIKEALVKASDELLTKKFAVTVVGEEYKSEADLEKLFESKLREKLNQNSADVNKGDSEEAKMASLNFAHTANLVGNDKLFALLAKADVDAMSDDELYDYIKEMNGVIVNNLSIIQQIKEQRIKWSDIMQEIENKTIAVDKYYSQDSYEQIGGIRYTSYDFDGNGPSISITGETKRFDTINFTIIVSLIEKLNESPLFANGEMRSFTKSGSYEEGYTASLKISLDLEQFTEEEPDEGIDSSELELFNIEGF